MNDPFLPEDLLQRLRQARRVVALTGAGISAESGIPTFRDAQTGLWARYRPEDLATPEAYLRHPRLVWEWYAWRRDLVRQAQPNPAHLALAVWEGMCPDFSLVTQNVDDLHARAGSRRILPLHGNIFTNLCFPEGVERSAEPDCEEIPPRCAVCGGMLRPGVVWFGEGLPPQVVAQAWNAVEHCEVLVVIGTSGLVHPAAGLPALARRRGAFVLEINPCETPLSSQCHLTLRDRAARILPRLVSNLM